MDFIQYDIQKNGTKADCLESTSCIGPYNISVRRKMFPSVQTYFQIYSFA